MSALVRHSERSTSIKCLFNKGYSPLVPRTPRSQLAAAVDFFCCPQYHLPSAVGRLLLGGSRQAAQGTAPMCRRPSLCWLFRMNSSQCGALAKCSLCMHRPSFCWERGLRYPRALGNLMGARARKRVERGVLWRHDPMSRGEPQREQHTQGKVVCQTRFCQHS